MANELPNAVALMRSADFRSWVMAGACYQAALVIGSANVPTKTMASSMLLNPTGPLLDRLVNVLATRLEVCSVGATVGEAPGQVGQTLLLAQLAIVWTPLATLLYP